MILAMIWDHKMRHVWISSTNTRDGEKNVNSPVKTRVVKSFWLIDLEIESSQAFRCSSALCVASTSIFTFLGQEFGEIWSATQNLRSSDYSCAKTSADKLKPFFDKFPHFPDDPLSPLPRQFISVSSCSLRLVLLISIFNFIICGVNTQRHKLDFCRIGCEVDADFSVLSRIGIHSLVEAFALSHCCWGNLMMSFKWNFRTMAFGTRNEWFGELCTQTNFCLCCLCLRESQCSA